MNRHLVEKDIRDANIYVFDNKHFDEYESNPSIFEPSRQKDIDKIVQRASLDGNNNILDIGCGTGNILRIASNYFKNIHGIDVSANLLGELKRRQNNMHLLVGEATYIPYKSSYFDMITMYGVLHHILNHRNVFNEVYRALRNGGMLYIDHDPNYFFGRFYHIFYRIRYLNKHGFGTAVADLSEYHHTQTGGLNPLEIKDALLAIGFRSVDVHFRLTTNPNLPFGYKVIHTLLILLSKIYPAKSLFTHFWILARK